MSKYCQKCGAQNIDEAQFCGSCGASISTQTFAQDSVNTENTQSMKECASVEQKDVGYTKFEGLLLAFAILLAINLLTSFIGLVDAYTNSTQNLIYTLYFEDLAPIAYLVILSSYTSIIGFVLLVVFAIAFYTKSSDTKLISFIVFGFTIVSNLIAAVIILGYKTNNIFDYINIGTINRLVLGSVFAAIWIVYFLKSNRVKKTFVNPTNNISSIVGIAVFCGGILTGYYYNNSAKVAIYSVSNSDIKDGKFYNKTSNKLVDGYAIINYNEFRLAGLLKNGQLYYGVSKVFSKSKILLKEFQYEDGKQNGIQKVYYENGQLAAEATFVNGKRNGIQKEYYENGNLQFEATFKDGKLNGIAKTYYENGQLRNEATWKDDKLISGFLYDENRQASKLTNDEISRFNKHSSEPQ